MRILWRYLSPLRGLVLLSLTLAAVAQVLTLVDPIIFGRIIDDYAINRAGRAEQELVRGVLGWLGIAVAVATVARLAKAMQEYVLRLVVQRFGLRVFNDGLARTLRLSYEEFSDQSSGEAVAMLHKVRGDTERCVNGLVNVLFSSLVGLGFLIWYSVTRHWLLVPVFVLGAVVLGLLAGLLSQRIKSIQQVIFRQTKRLSGAITESLRNIEMVKSLGLALPETIRLRGLTQRIFDLEMEKTRKVRTLSFLQGTTINLLKHSILFILLWLIFRNTLTTGELISMQVILAIIFVPLQDLGNVVINFREAEASLQSFGELLDKPMETQPESPVEIGLLTNLRFDEVVFRHRNAPANSIDGITFEAQLGDTIAFVGPSGAGKSTLVKLLVGLYQPQSGRVLIDGVPFNELRFNRVRRQFGIVSQDSQLFSGTVRENLLFVAPEATDQEMFDVLRRASVLPLIERTGQGLDTRLGEGGQRVSGGERQRLSIARALLRKPRLFIFDEATSALDSITEQEITASMREVSARREQIVVLIAHRLSTISHADTIYVLEKGRITESGGHAELLEMDGLYHAMWRQQIGER
jgi:ATP-binding cassette subfamily B protein